MGAITETPNWESQVKQIEVNEPVGGGPDAPANVQAKHLANRTAYLKQEQDSLKTRVDGAEGKLGDGSIADCLKKAQNLADLPDKAASRGNLGAAPTTHDHDDRYPLKSANLSDLDNADQARANLGAAQEGHLHDERYQKLSEKGQPGGYPGLDAGGKVQEGHIPNLPGKMDTTGGSFSGLVTFDSFVDNTGTVIDWTHGNRQKKMLNANAALTFISPVKAAGLFLELVTGSTAYSVTWPSSVKWVGGSPPDTSTPNKKYMIAFVFDETDYIGSCGGGI